MHPSTRSRFIPLTRPSTPAHSPNTALSIHGVVTYFLVDKLGGSWSQLSDEYVWRLIPEPIKAKAKAAQAKFEAKVA